MGVDRLAKKRIWGKMKEFIFLFGMQDFFMCAKQKLWYAGGLQFECRECGGCCSGAPGYVWLSEEEIQRIAERFGISVEDCEAKFVREVGERKSLIEYPNGDCVFYDRFHTNCKIYRDRPAQCRTWPFWASNLESEKEWEKISRTWDGIFRFRRSKSGKIFANCEKKSGATLDFFAEFVHNGRNHGTEYRLSEPAIGLERSAGVCRTFSISIKYRVSLWIVVLCSRRRH